MDKKVVKKVDDVVGKLLDLIEVPCKLDVELEKTDDIKLINVRIKSEEGLPLIGFKGRTLRALQTLVVNMLHFEDPEYRISVDVNDFKVEHSNSLKERALSAIEQIKKDGKKVDLGLLNSFDRRIVHMTVAECKDCVTQSVGVGRMKRIFVLSKDDKMDVESVLDDNKEILDSLEKETPIE